MRTITAILIIIFQHKKRNIKIQNFEFPLQFLFLIRILIFRIFFFDLAQPGLSNILFKFRCFGKKMSGKIVYLDNQRVK